MGDVCVFVCGSRQQAKAVFTSTKTKTHLVPHHLFTLHRTCYLCLFFSSKVNWQASERPGCFPTGG